MGFRGLFLRTVRSQVQRLLPQRLRQPAHAARAHLYLILDQRRRRLLQLQQYAPAIAGIARIPVAAVELQRRRRG